jgi:hypothetical protein
LIHEIPRGFKGIIIGEYLNKNVCRLRLTASASGFFPSQRNMAVKPGFCYKIDWRLKEAGINSDSTFSQLSNPDGTAKIIRHNYVIKR